MEDSSSVIINGIRINADILQKDAIRRCADSSCGAVCCSGGVWLREDEAPRIREWEAAIKACLPVERHDESLWFEQGKEELGTSSVDDPQIPGRTCCVFLQPDRKCALQVVSIANNLGWPGIKPYYCAIYPLLIEDGVLSIDDETPLIYEGGLCRQSTTQGHAAYELYRDEAILILGQDGYRELLDKAKR
jgi:Fe-S-cluster containining protein